MLLDDAVGMCGGVVFAGEFAVGEALNAEIVVGADITIYANLQVDS